MCPLSYDPLDSLLNAHLLIRLTIFDLSASSTIFIKQISTQTMPARTQRSLRQNTNESAVSVSTTDSYDDSPSDPGRYGRDRARNDEYSTSDRRRNKRLDSHESGRRREGEDDHKKRETRRRRHERDDSEAEDRQRRRERRERRARRRARKEAETYGEDKYIPIESPPPYDEKARRTKDKDRPSPKRTASQDQGEEEEATQPTTDRLLSKLERIGGPFIYIIPLLTAFCLLAASTCSADWWRKDVNVIRLGLPGDIYARLLATGNNLGKGGGEAVVDSGGKVQERAAKISPAGWLSVGFWGWCVGPEGDGP